MTISNKIAMDIAINGLDAATTCPAWLVWTLIGLMGALLMGAVVAIATANR